MKSPLRLVFTSFLLTGATVLAQPPELEPGIVELGVLSETLPFSAANGMSADGQFVVGRSSTDGGEIHAFRWTLAGGMEDLGTIDDAPGGSFANDVSDDGSVVVGFSATTAGPDHAFRFTAGTMADLGTIGGATGGSSARGVSADGQVVVGDSTAPSGATHAYRWTSAGGMVDLGTIGGSTGDSFAEAVSNDGSVIAGRSVIPASTRFHAFRWTSGTGIVDLDTLTGHTVSAAFGISGGGEFLVGLSTADPTVATATPMSFSEATGMIGLAQDGPTAAVEDVSADGRVAVGLTVIAGGETEGTVWRDGQPVSLAELLSDAGVDLSDWSALENLHAISANGRVVCGEGTFLPLGETVAFRAVLPNEPPTVEAPQPITVECDGGTTRLVLAAEVDDPDSASLTVRWLVDGTLRKTQTLTPGATSNFAFNYSDGESDVTIEVTDGDITVTEGATVTVEDTTDPTIVVTPNVTLSVDPGKNFASRNRLPEPDVTDICDENPTLRNDAPPRLKLGNSRVRWTSEDDDGNVARVSQKVKVVNDKPVADAGRTIRLRTSGSTARARLDGTASSDPNDHKLSFLWSARNVPFANANKATTTATFPIGTTTVKLTVTDQFGAKATDTVRVIVRFGGQSAAEIAEDETARALEGASRSANASAHQAARNAYLLGLAASISDDPIERLELRLAQSGASQAAGDELLRSYLNGSQEEALETAVRSYRGAAHGLLDLSK